MRAARMWAQEMAFSRPDVLRIGCFGSYARGDAGVGSDLDLVAIVGSATRPFAERAVDWPSERLPVPADLLVYTEDEWNRLLLTGSRFANVMTNETVWLWPA